MVKIRRRKSSAPLESQGKMHMPRQIWFGQETRKLYVVGPNMNLL